MSALGFAFEFRQLHPTAVWTACGLTLAVGAVWRRGGQSTANLERGARILPARRRRAAPGSGAGITLAGERLALLDETKHFKLIGTTGTGKSTAIGELLAGALNRGDRALVSDPDGHYWTQFASRYRGDALLNPFESGSRCWDVFAELRAEYDVEQLASALIPQSIDPAGQEWRGYGRTLLVVLMRFCRDHARDLDELWRLLAFATAEELRPLVTGTAAQPFLEPENARMFGSIRSVAMAAIAALEHVKAQRARPLSLKQWVRAGRGSLFLPYRAGQIAALRTVIAAWIRIALYEAMDQQPGVDQRLWFVVDELDALGAIDGLKDALARLRKYGGRCVLGMQSIAQMSGTYGQSDAQTIVENCGNTLILRCGGSENGGTSQFASRLVGEREVLRRQVVRGRDRDAGFGKAGGRNSTQISEQRSIESALLASELEQLPDLEGYLKLASAASWRRVRLRR